MRKVWASIRTTRTPSINIHKAVRNGSVEAQRALDRLAAVK